jgi:hypothetical protein
MPLALMKYYSLHILIGACFGTLAGLLVGWASAGHGILNNNFALLWAGFGACAGALAGHVLAALRYERSIGRLYGTVLGTSFGLMLAWATELSYAWPLALGTWIMHALSGGLAGWAVGASHMPERLYAWLSMVSSAMARSTTLWLSLARGVGLGAAAGLTLSVLLVANYSARIPGNWNGSLDVAGGYYCLLPLGAVLGLALSSLRRRKLGAASPNDLARGLTCALLSVLIVFVIKAASGLASDVMDRISPTVAWFSPVDPAETLVISCLIASFALALGVITTSLLPSTMTPIDALQKPPEN